MGIGAFDLWGVNVNTECEVGHGESFAKRAEEELRPQVKTRKGGQKAYNTWQLCRFMALFLGSLKCPKFELSDSPDLVGAILYALD